MNNGNRRKMWKFIPTERRLEIVRMIEEMPAGLHKDVLTLCFKGDMSTHEAADYAKEHNMLIGKQGKPICAKRIEQIIKAYVPDAWDYGIKNPQRAYKRRLHHDMLRTYNKDHCAMCGATDNLELDHIIPLAIGGTTDERNVMCLCRECHKAKSAYERETFPEQYRWRKPKVVYGDGSEQLRME